CARNDYDDRWMDYW
nr:immunoglobulin heavy chain junction region [Mus musculus]